MGAGRRPSEVHPGGASRESKPVSHHHCHILLHEDMGMMQGVECVDEPARANYRTRQRVANHDMSGPEVDAIYPPPSPELMYLQNMTFVDPNDLGGQVYPGFPLEIPTLEE